MKHSAALTGLVPLCLGSIPSFAQEPQLNWNTFYYTGASTNVGTRVVLGDSDDVYVLGQDASNADYLTRYRSYDGQLQWQLQWDSAVAAVDLVRGTDGNLFAAWTYFNEPFNTPRDVGVSAWTSAGVPLWTYYWNDSLYRDDHVRDMHLDPDGNVLLCVTSEEDPYNPTFYNNISVLKLDPAGNLLWRRTWDGAIHQDDEPRAITCDVAGNIYVTGYTTSAGINGMDLLLLKYSPTGVLQWQQVINRNSGFGSHVDVGTQVLVDGNGNAIVAGTTESLNSDNGQDFSLYAFSPAGSNAWSYHYNNQNEESLLDLERGPDGDLYLLGRYTANAGDGEVVLRVNPAGTLQWASTYATTSLDARYPSALSLSPDGNLITTGTVGDQLLRDAYVRAYDPDGVALWTYRYTAENSQNIEEGHDVAVGPNRSIYVAGRYDQVGQSLIRGLAFCLCPVADGVCLHAPEISPVFPTSAMAGLDLDQDGWRDLVFSAPLPNTLGVYMGSPSGFTQGFPLLLPTAPSLLATGDLDSDGDMDVVAGTYAGPDLQLALNNAGVLTAGSTLPIPQDVVDLKVADLDGENGPDIVAIMTTAPNLVVYLNNGDGSFTATYPAAVANPYRVAVGDADADGVPDLLIGRVVYDSVYVLHGDGNGGFSAPDGFESGTTAPAEVGLGDFNSDGINDLVTCNGSTTWAARLGTGGGNFAPPITGNVGTVYQFLIAPFPEDSTLCLLTGNDGSTGRVGYSRCSHTYQYLDLATTAAGNHLVEVADWTNDGSPDLLSYYTDGQIRLWRNCDTLGLSTAVPVFGKASPRAVLVLYPVPATDAVTILRPAAAMGVAEVRITSARGDLLRHFASSAPQEVLPLDQLAAGFYTVQYRSASGTWTARLALVGR